MEEKQAIEVFLRTRTEVAFCALFTPLYGRVCRYFLLRGLDAATAEELTQNVMLTVYLRAGDVREERLFYGWLFKIAKNELLHYRRRQRARAALAEFEPLSEAIAAQLTTEADASRRANFAEWMAELEPHEREIVVLRFVEELSYEELSVALQIPIGTVKGRLFRAKKKLSQIIGATFLISALQGVN